MVNRSLRWKNRLGPSMLLAGLVLPAVSPAAVGTNVFASVGTRAFAADSCSASVSPGPSYNATGAPLSRQASLLASAPGVLDNRLATASASLGALRAAPFVQLNNATTAGAAGSTSARTVNLGATAGFLDRVQLGYGTLTGTLGTAQASWAITGTSTANGGSLSQSNWTVAMRLYAEEPPSGNAPVQHLMQVVGGAGSFSAKTFSTDSAGVATERFLLSGIWTGAATINFPIPLVFGAYYGMTQFINADATASVSANGVPQTSNVTTDFSHTAFWNGISSVTDASGAALSGWQMAAESGANYGAAYGTPGFAGPVPEPGSLALAALGTVALAGLCARRRRNAGTAAAAA